jgi:hypothetical protein
MATYRADQIGSWVTKTKKRMDAVTKQATNDLMVLASRTAPGTIRGGSVKPGFVPRDTGFLAASLVSSLNGSTALSGEGSYRLVVAGMEAGDTAFFGWTAEYARVQHYKGWLWVATAANEWPRIVRDAVARAKLVESAGLR